MNKIKKIFVSFGVLFTGWVSKVFAITSNDVKEIETKYGVFKPEPTMGKKILDLGKFTLPVILFVIGLFVILSKKITKKIKKMVVIILIILAIFAYVLMNYNK